MERERRKKMKFKLNFYPLLTKHIKLGIREE